MPFPPTTWEDWTPDEYQVGAPATSSHFERWFRNPVAAAQGAPGAPRVEPLALHKPQVAMGAITTGFTAFTGLGRAASVRLFMIVTPSGSAGAVSIGFSTDNGSSYGSSQALFSAITANEGWWAYMDIDFETGAVVGVAVTLSATATPGQLLMPSPLTIPAGTNAFRITASNRTGRIHTQVTGGLE